MLNKKGGMTIGEIVGIILGAATVFLLVIFLFGLFNQGYDLEKETAKSYLSSMEKGILEARDFGESRVSFLEVNKDYDFALVYFGGKGVLRLTQELQSVNEDFDVSTKLGENRLCICVTKKSESSYQCNSCKDLKDEILLEGGEGAYLWRIENGKALEIRYDKDSYEFAKGGLKWLIDEGSSYPAQ